MGPNRDDTSPILSLGQMTTDWDDMLYERIPLPWAPENISINYLHINLICYTNRDKRCCHVSIRGGMNLTHRSVSRMQTTPSTRAIQSTHRSKHNRGNEQIQMTVAIETSE